LPCEVSGSYVLLVLFKRVVEHDRLLLAENRVSRRPSLETFDLSQVILPPDGLDTLRSPQLDFFPEKPDLKLERIGLWIVPPQIECLRLERAIFADVLPNARLIALARLH